MTQSARFRQARELRGITQESLATRIGFSQATVALIETGALSPREEYVKACAVALGVPEAFFEGTPVALAEGSLGLFRARKKEVTAADIAMARQSAALAIEFIQTLSSGLKPPTPRLPDVSDYEPEDAAQVIRNAMRLDPHGPIDNLIAAAERAGIWIIGMSSLHSDIDGFCTWGKDERPVVVYNREKSAYRIRFTVSHELVHLARRHEAFRGPVKVTENDAMDICGRLLLPTDSIKEDFAHGVTLTSLAPLKKKWQVSLHMLAMTAKKTGDLTDAGYRAIQSQLKDNGWLKVEPGDLVASKEKPRLPYQLAERRKIYQNGAVALAIEMGLPEDLISDLLQREIDPLERLLA